MTILKKNLVKFFLVLLVIAQIFFVSCDFKDNSKAEIPDEKNMEVVKTEEKIPEPVKEIEPEEKFIVKSRKITDKTIYEELREENIPAPVILELADDFKGKFNFRNARKGDLFRIKLAENGELKSFFYKPGIFTEYYGEKNHDGSFEVTEKEILPEIEIKTAEFEIDSCLYNAIVDSGEKRELVSMFTDIFSWDIDFYLYPRKGDRIQIKYEKKYIDGKLCGYGRIVSARYIGKKENFSAFYFADGKNSGYYDETGRPIKKMFLRVPVKFGVKTSSFSIRRFHPVTKKYRSHTGIDYGARKGTPIFATASGKVIHSDWLRGYGKLVIIRHTNGYKTYYGHCNSLIAKKGDLVDQGEIIARVGETGIATGPHVHYEVRVNNKPINPNTVKTIKAKRISDENFAKFKKRVDADLKEFAELKTKEDKLIALKFQ